MLKLLKNLMGFSPKENFGELIQKGAIIIDVRTKSEYAGGHVKGSLNIPLDQISTNLARIKSKEQVIITCCASGMRSGSAKRLLKSLGYSNVHNGGAWQNLNAYGK